MQMPCFQKDFFFFFHLHCIFNFSFFSIFNSKSIKDNNISINLFDSMENYANEDGDFFFN
jgi:hypothetical protein